MSEVRDSWLHDSVSTLSLPRSMTAAKASTWAGSIERARQWIAISRRKEHVDGSGQHEQYVKIGGSAGHSQLFQLDVDEGVRPNRQWHVTVKTGREAAAENADALYQNDAEKVRKALADGPLCITPLRDAAGIRSTRIRGVVERMVEEATLSEVRSGARIKYALNS